MAKKDKKIPGPGHIEIKDMLRAINNKDRGWWDRLTDAQKQKFSHWMGNRYVSSVGGSTELQQYYLRATNLYSNRRAGSISRSNHGKLGYLLLTTATVGDMNPRHIYIQPMRSLKSKNSALGAKARVLLDLYPHMKVKDIELWSELLDLDQFQNIMLEHGFTNQQIARVLRDIDNSDQEDN